MIITDNKSKKLDISAHIPSTDRTDAKTDRIHKM